MIDSAQPLSIKYFSHVMEEIRMLFDFHPKIKTEVEEYGNKLFGSDTSHKACIHIRRNDFVTHDFLGETKAEFLIPAMAAVRAFVIKKYSIQNVSLVFFTDDEKFVDSLKYPKDKYFKVYRPNLPSRGPVMYFGTRYCDSLLMSAGGSTFGAWIGYLMPEKKDIFYNQHHRKGNMKYSGRRTNDGHRYPKHWNALELNEKNKTVVIIN